MKTHSRQLFVGSAKASPARTSVDAFLLEGRPRQAWCDDLYDLTVRERSVQIVASFIGLLLLSPLLVLIAVLIKATSRGPVLYSGERVGKFGERYKIFKFRTLQVGAEDKIGARLLTKGDSYYTPIGRMLKKTKLDELPQLFNVIRGDMNLVGPRPVRPIFLGEFEEQIPKYRLRFLVRPGITGLAQIRGSYYTHARHKLRYELFYVMHRSFLMDFKLIILTFLKILNRTVTLGAVLLFLFLFVSFVPAIVQDQMYINPFGIRLNMLHIVVLILGTWLVAKKIPSHRLYVYRNNLNLPILAFIFIGAISAFFSQAPEAALRGLGYYTVTGFFVALLIMNTPITSTFLMTGGKVVALACAAISAIGLLKLVAAGNITAEGIASTADPTTVSSTSIVSTMATPEALAMYLILGIPFVLTQVTYAKRREVRDFWVICVTVSVIGILLTKSVVGLVGLLVTVTAYGTLYLRFRLSNTLIIALAVTVICVSLWVNFKQRSGATPNLWTMAVDTGRFVRQTPIEHLLVGVGSRSLTPNPQAVPRRNDMQQELPEYMLRNGHFRLLLENGILGWGVFMWIVIEVLRTIVRAAKFVTDDYTKSILWGTFSAILGFTIGLIEYSAFSSLTLQLFFWSLVGSAVAAALHRTGRSEGFRILWRFGRD